MKLRTAFLACMAIFCAFPCGAATVEELIVQSDALDEKNRNREALELTLEADRLRPNDAEILRRVAKQYAQLILEASSKSQKRELAAKALKAAEDAVKADPRNAKARLSLAIVLGRAAQLESPKKQVEMSKRIREEAEKSLQLDPSDDYAWHVLGRWNFELANFNPILKSFAEIIYGKFPDASNEKAAECFQKAISLGPPRVVHHIEYGRTLSALGKTAEARAQIQKGLALPSTAKDDDETKERGRKTLRSLN